MSLEPTQLPSWIFDVDDEDKIDLSKSLLEVLEVDVQFVLRNTIWSISGPLSLLLSNTYISSWTHPFQRCYTNEGNNVDFWGPCGIISLYGAILWLINVSNVPWLYVLWIFAGIFNHLITRYWYTNSSIVLHMSLIGYSCTPIMLLSSLIYISRRILLISISLKLLSLVLSVSSALITYQSICDDTRTPTQSTPPISSIKTKLSLLIPPIILIYIYFISLIPI